MDEVDGPEYVDQAMELEDEAPLELGDSEDEEMKTKLSNVPSGQLALDILTDETTRLAAGLASKVEGELLVAISAMQKAVTGKDGENVLVSYVLASPQCVELTNIWQAGSGSATAVPLMQLLYHMFKHHLGKVGGQVKDRDSDSQRRLMTAKLRLDKLARSLVRNRMKDIYSHLSSSQRSRQNAGLLLLSAMVLRGRALGTEIATTFDFTLEALKRLGRPSKKQTFESQKDMLFKRPTRFAFVEFAMSFLEVGDAGVLRWILQKRPLFAGVLNALSKDNESIMVKVLVLFQEKVMAPEFMVPRGLQSVLFGDITLEQLARISADKTLELANEFAHDILVELCTDPSHGLCPESSEIWDTPSGQTGGAFGGGQARLLRLMNRLKVTEVDRHRDLLLAIGRVRPKFAAAYLTSIPLSLEPRVSPAWFRAMSLVAMLIPIASQAPPFLSLAGQDIMAPPHDGPLIRSTLLSLLPSPLSRVALNRGLQHADIMVKNACLRVLYEALVSLRRLLQAVDAAAAACSQPFQGSSGISSTAMESNASTDKESGGESQKEQWLKLSQSIQDTMRAYLPDPKVVMNILPSLKAFSITSGNGVATLTGEGAHVTAKKRKRTDAGTEDGSNEQVSSVTKYDYEATILEFWGSEGIVDAGRRGDSEILLHSKVVEVLAAFQRVLPIALADTNFDAFKLLPDNPVCMPGVQQNALTSLLLAVTGYTTSPSSENSRGVVGEFGGVGSAHKRLKPLLLLMLSTDLTDVREAAYLIIHRIMISTGAFVNNLGEIRLWLDALVGWKVHKSHDTQTAGESTDFDRNSLAPGTIHASLVDFLAESVSSIGQGIYHYLDRLHNILSKLTLETSSHDVYIPEFGPFVICTLETCFRSAKSKTVYQRAAVATYVATVLNILRKYQVHPRALVAVVCTELSTGFTSIAQQQHMFEWFSLQILLQQFEQLLPSAELAQFSGTNKLSALDQTQNPEGGKILAVLKACKKEKKKKEKNIARESKLEALRSLLLCIPVKELVDNFPLLMLVSAEIFDGDSSTVVALLGVHQSLLCDISTAWPEMFSLAVELAGAVKNVDGETVSLNEIKTSVSKSIESSKVSEAVGLSAFLLRCPFVVLFSAAVYGNKGSLLTNQAFTKILEAAALKVPQSNRFCAVRVVVSEVKHVVAASTEGGSSLDICFSLLCSLVSPTQLKSVGDDMTGLAGAYGENIMGIYQHMIVDLLNHPALHTLFLRSNSLLTGFCPLVGDLRRDNKDEKICDTSLRRVLASAASSMNDFDGHILVLLTRLLESVQILCRSAILPPLADQLRTLQHLVVEAFGSFVRKAVTILRKEVEESPNLGVIASPSLFVVSVLIPYTDLSSTIDFLLSLLSVGRNKVKKSKQAAAPHVLGLHLATVFIDSLSGGTEIQRFQRQQSENWKWGQQSVNDSESQLIFDLFEKVLEQVISNPSVMADLCLLSFLQALDPKLAVCQKSEELYHRFDKTRFGDLARCTPLAVLRHCVMRPNKVTGTIATLLVESSFVHLSELGWLIVEGTADRSQGTSSGQRLSFADKMLVSSVKTQKLDLALSDEDLFSLLQAVEVYLKVKSGKESAEEKEAVSHVAAVYGSYLVKQLKSWDKFVSKEAVSEWYLSKRLPGILSVAYRHSPGRMLEYCHYSPLGQVVRTLRLCHSLHALSTKLQDRLLKSLLSQENVPLVSLGGPKIADEDVCRIVCEVVAKVDILRYLLNSGLKLESGDLEESQSIAEEAPNSVVGGQLEDGQKDSIATQRFLSSLVYTLGALYKSGGIDWKDETVGASPVLQAEAGRIQWLPFLEEFLLAQVTHTAEELLDLSVDLTSFIPVYRYSLATFLGYRYGIPSAMKAARYLSLVYFQCLLESNKNGGQTLDINALELLISHSRFLPSMLGRYSTRMQIPHLSGKHAGKGTALNSLTSVLLLVGSPLVDHVETLAEGKMEAPAETPPSSDVHASAQSQNLPKDDKSNLVDRKKIELVKLLRILVSLRLKQCSLDMASSESLPLEQILSVLLAAYGATMSELDQEIFTLMREIESHGGPGFTGLSGLDYLWGEAALKPRKAKSDQMASSKSGLDEPESLIELRRQTFKEDLGIDPRRCGLTVLFFPPKRQIDVLGVGQVQPANHFKDSSKEPRGRGLGAMERELHSAAYDPAFLLPFAVHGLSMGCISAEEFVRLGFLAVAFASISSADESMRKSGYEVLAKYYAVLEGCPSFKGRTQIQLLMTYIKNSVAEAWQKVPLVLSVFAAEASCILMNPENHHYLSINRFLLRAPSLDMESIPLFQIMFGSGSVQYRSDRLWMLRLLAAGLGSSIDAHIYRRKFVLELLMSFHDSAIADTFTRKWVLQVLYQAANVRSCSQYLIEHTGLLSWLASVAVTDCESNSGPEENYTEGELARVSLKVIESIMSWGVVQRHFLTDGTEELSKVALMFHRFLVRNSTSKYQKIFLRPTINIMTSVLRMSHRRKKHQTHFTLNIIGIQEVITWIEGGVMSTRSLGYVEERTSSLKMILHSSPPPVLSAQDKVRLYDIASWAVQVVQKSELETPITSNISTGSSSQPQKLGPGEPLRQKLLRWLAAALVLGDISRVYGSPDDKEKFATCLSLVSAVKKVESTNGVVSPPIDVKLARLLLSLQGHVNMQAEVPSLVTLIATVATLTPFTGSMNQDDDGSRKDSEKIRSVLELLLSELPCPEETNPSWLWSFSGPWTVHGARSLDENAAVEARYVFEVCCTLFTFLQLLWSKRHSTFSSSLVNLEAHISDDHSISTTSGSDSCRDKVSLKLALLQDKFCRALQRRPHNTKDFNKSE